MKPSMSKVSTLCGLSHDTGLLVNSRAYFYSDISLIYRGYIHALVCGNTCSLSVVGLFLISMYIILSPVCSQVAWMLVSMLLFHVYRLMLVALRRHSRASGGTSWGLILFASSRRTRRLEQLVMFITWQKLLIENSEEGKKTVFQVHVCNFKQKKTCTVYIPTLFFFFFLPLSSSLIICQVLLTNKLSPTTQHACGELECYLEYAGSQPFRFPELLNA